MRRYLFPGLCVIALVLALHTMTLASGISAALPVETVAIVSADGARHEFRAHLADTPETRERGLMYVTSIEPDQGMLFDFAAPRLVGMWMKNTPLSLDMLFIDEAGRIARIEARTRPFSTALISSETEVRAVLEINGGRAAELGIAAGDLVQHRIFE
jgi:uncharacterized membrane protein (UPF0127 family)